VKHLYGKEGAYLVISGREKVTDCSMTNDLTLLTGNGW